MAGIHMNGLSLQAPQRGISRNRGGTGLGLVLAIWLAFDVVAAEIKPAAEQDSLGARPKVLSKEIFLRHENRRPVATGFITYVSRTKPVLK